VTVVAVDKRSTDLHSLNANALFIRLQLMSGVRHHKVSRALMIDWAEFTHAYGSAANVPSLLDVARRAPAGGTYTEEPWFSLWSALCHQGDVYTASYAAVPELVAIAQARIGEHAAARECVLLAGAIELERAHPQGPQPPTMPAAIRGSYAEAMAVGARIGESLLEVERDPDYARALESAIAAMRGDAAEARRLSDADEDAE
jgi:hypothetical protein